MKTTWSIFRGKRFPAPLAIDRKIELHAYDADF